MAILETLARQPMRAKDLADTLELKWATAYRTLTYFEEQGYLELSESTGEYSISGRMYALGSSYLVGHRFAEASGYHLRTAAEQMRCSAQANEREGLTVLTLVASDPPTEIPKTSPGFTFPLGVAAKGQVLLAFAPTAVQERFFEQPLPAFTQHTITDPERLKERLTRIRADGYATTREDLQVGVGSVAAAVRDDRNEVIGCISLVVRNTRMDEPGFTDEIVDCANTTAQDISIAMGWRPRPQLDPIGQT